jgi:hypothetical protein
MSTGFLLRILAGEPLIKMPAIIPFPMYNDTDGQLFPFRTFIMLLSIAVIILVSLLLQLLFERGIISPRYDVCQCLRHRTITMRQDDVTEEEAARADEDGGGKEETLLTKSSTADGVKWALAGEGKEGEGKGGEWDGEGDKETALSSPLFARH